MLTDTSAINQARRDCCGRDSVWLFGYGSLIYKTGFPWLERRPASMRGWARRFWQGSQDHRGTPDRPGRVATLVEQRDATCRGMAYRVACTTLAQLDQRERNGYLRRVTSLTFDDKRQAEALVYIAHPDNGAWLGPASAAACAHRIATSTGHSGPNRDYLLRLATALRQLGTHDEHVFGLEAELLRLLGHGETAPAGQVQSGPAWRPAFPAPGLACVA